MSDKRRFLINEAKVFCFVVCDGELPDGIDFSQTNQNQNKPNGNMNTMNAMNGRNDVLYDLNGNVFEGELLGYESYVKEIGKRVFGLKEIDINVFNGKRFGYFGGKKDELGMIELIKNFGGVYVPSTSTKIKTQEVDTPDTNETSEETLNEDVDMAKEDNDEEDLDIFLVSAKSIDQIAFITGLNKMLGGNTLIYQIGRRLDSKETRNMIPLFIDGILVSYYVNWLGGFITFSLEFILNASMEELMTLIHFVDVHFYYSI